MCDARRNPEHRSDDYGRRLYNAELFKRLFPDFDKDQKASAELIWDRILSRCGTDPDLPRITHVVDYGCGEGTFLKHLASCAEGQSSKIKFLGLDCSQTAIALAKKSRSHVTFEFCDPCPVAALPRSLPAGLNWNNTALLIMAHTWFHFDQECLIKTILTLRPALLLVDVYSSWNSVIAQLYGKNESSLMEHGRPPENGRTFWLKTERIESTEPKVIRGIWSEASGCDGEWLFRTIQSAHTTEEIFGGVEKTAELALQIKKQPSKIPGEVLRKGRTAGKLVNPRDKEVGFVRQRAVHHQTGWGAMDCHVLVARDPDAGILNEAFFQVIGNVIQDSVVKQEAPNAERIRTMLSLFDDPSVKKAMRGSREAMVILPFDPCMAFTRIVPLSKIKSEICEHSLLIEHPSRAQTHYPSANAVFQTCLARSSSAQAFATGWAPDYQLTAVDCAIEELELRVLGLNSSDRRMMKRGRWGDEKEYPSYFMLPIYFGSLPLFCLALKFPKPFEPATTAFDVFYSSLRSLHDGIMVMLTDEVIGTRILRPWLELILQSSFQADRCRGMTSGTVDEKLARVEEYMFGSALKRNGGVVGKPWKSWILGLPSYPINMMASVQAQNNRLWNIWKNERRIAEMNPSLRISHWFQEAHFFAALDGGDDGPHDKWRPDVHLTRLELLRNIVDITDKKNASRYFGKAITQHYLFEWMKDKIAILQGPDESFKGGAFDELKAVFCKTLGNKGGGIRFSLLRFCCILEAAAPNKVTRPQEMMKCLKNAGLDSAYHDNDPSMLMGDFLEAVHELEDEHETVSVSVNNNSVDVTISVTIVLQGNAGGTKCDRFISAFHNLSEVATITPGSPCKNEERRWDIAFKIYSEANQPKIAKLL